MLLTLDDKLFLAPIQNPKRALDIGTGAGTWAVYEHDIIVVENRPDAEIRDFADAFPSTEVIGDPRFSASFPRNWLMPTPRHRFVTGPTELYPAQSPL